MTLAPALVDVPSGRLLMGSSSGRPDEQPVHAVEVRGIPSGRHAGDARAVRAVPRKRRGGGAALVERSGVRRSRSARGRCHLGGRGRVHAVARPHARRALAPADRSGVGVGRPRRPRAGRDRLGRRAAPGRGAGRSARGAVARRARHAERFRPLRHGHDRARVVCGLVRPVRSARAEPEEGARRASRGGSWRHRVRWSPPSARSSLPPSSRYADYGFRVLCASG